MRPDANHAATTAATALSVLNRTDLRRTFVTDGVVEAWRK